MAITTFGPHRGADWLGRVALSVEHPSAAAERFALRLKDPKHPRALWVQWTVDASPGATCVRVDAIYEDAGRALTRRLGEVWPTSRLLVDPERSGLGVGECHLAEGRAYGLLRDPSCALAFELSFLPKRPGALLAPGPTWHRGRRLDSHVVLPEPEAVIEHGFVELWQGLGRNAPRERLDVTGWQIDTSHAWGAAPVTPSWMVTLRPDAEQAASLTICSYPHRMWGLVPRQATVGEASAGELSLVLCGARQLLGPPAAQAPQLPRLAFLLQGAAGRLVGEVVAPTDATHVMPGPHGASLHVCLRAALTATLEVFGQAAVPLRSQRCVLEAVLPPAAP